MKYGVFISYARTDVKLIDPIKKLVRALREDLVFQDQDSITPGQLWEPQLLKALDESDIMLIFWCNHAAESDYVKHEYELAIHKNKIIIPLLMDDTKISESLGRYQWIDFRDLIMGSHEIINRQLENLDFPDQWWATNVTLPDIFLHATVKRISTKINDILPPQV